MNTITLLFIFCYLIAIGIIIIRVTDTITKSDQIAKQWKERTKCISNIDFYIGVMQNKIDALVKNNNIKEEDLQSIIDTLRYISSLTNSIRNYESESF